MRVAAYPSDLASAGVGQVWLVERQQGPEGAVEGALWCTSTRIGYVSQIGATPGISTAIQAYINRAYQEKKQAREVYEQLRGVFVGLELVEVDLAGLVALLDRIAQNPE